MAVELNQNVTPFDDKIRILDHVFVKHFLLNLFHFLEEKKCSILSVNDNVPLSISQCFENLCKIVAAMINIIVLMRSAIWNDDTSIVW